VPSNDATKPIIDYSQREKADSSLVPREPRKIRHGAIDTALATYVISLAIDGILQMLETQHCGIMSVHSRFPRVASPQVALSADEASSRMVSDDPPLFLSPFRAYTPEE
jgi:hypothetical protein